MRSALAARRAGSESRTWLLLLAALAACGDAGGDAPVGRSRSAIVDGDVATSDASATAALLAQGKAHCTGVLVAPRFVLTAAHCLDPVPDAIGFGRERATTVRVRRTIAHPAYDPPTLAHDLALVELAATPAVAPASISATDLTSAIVDRQVRVEGYGVLDAKDTSASTLHAGNARASALTDTHLELRPAPALPCAGDSGGPVYANDAVIAIASYGDDACAEVSYATRTDVERAFITETIAHPLPEERDDDGCSVGPRRRAKGEAFDGSSAAWIAVAFACARAWRRRATAPRS